MEIKIEFTPIDSAIDFLQNLRQFLDRQQELEYIENYEICMQTEMTTSYSILHISVKSKELTEEPTSEAKKE